MHSPLPASDFDPGIGSHIRWWLQRYPSIDMVHLDRQIFQKTDASPLIRMMHSRSKHATTTRKRRFANDRKQVTVSGSISVFSGVTSFWRKSMGFASYRKPGMVYKIWWTWINHKRWLAAGHEFGMSQNAAGDSPTGLICRNWYNWYNLGPGRTHCHKWIGLVKVFMGWTLRKDALSDSSSPLFWRRLACNYPQSTVTTDGDGIPSRQPAQKEIRIWSTGQMESYFTHLGFTLK